MATTHATIPCSFYFPLFKYFRYPFAENDREQGFLQRAVAAYGDDVTEVSLQNYVYLGKPCYGNRRVIVGIFLLPFFFFLVGFFKNILLEDSSVSWG